MYLFTYGTLQNEAIQLDLFGRTLKGEVDHIKGFRVQELRFTSDHPEVPRRAYPAAIYTANPTDMIRGKVYRLSESELKQADQYETEAYSRIEVLLASGITAWIYVLGNCSF